MVSRRSFLAVMLATTLAGSASAAFATNRPATGPATTNSTAARASIELDGLMTAPNPFGIRLLNAYRVLRGLGRVSLPVRDTGYQTDGVQDGPDGWDPLGIKGRGLPADGPAPANTRIH